MFQVGKPVGKRPRGRPSIERRIILKCIVNDRWGTGE
jgi:hypothetical protein